MTEVELRDGVWFVREEGAEYALTCEIRVPAGERGVPNSQTLQTCGKPAAFRAITGAGDLSGQNYDERLCCRDCKLADEVSGQYIVNGELVEDYGSLYQYEEITEEWLRDA